MTTRHISLVDDRLASELPWIEKYRPKVLDDVIGQDHLMVALRAMIANNSLPHLLLCGPPGTGKTTTILAVANAMYDTPSQRQEHLIELNASNDRGINVIRERLIPFANTLTAKPKLIVLDEADNMTIDAQLALKRLMEVSAETCRFCLICNQVTAIDPGVVSRCSKQEYTAIPPADKWRRARYICEQEALHINEDALLYLCTNLIDFRQVISKLQYLKYSLTPTSPPLTIDQMAIELRLPPPTQLNELITLYAEASRNPVATFQTLYSQWQYHYYNNRCGFAVTVEALLRQLREAAHPKLSEERRLELMVKLLTIHHRLREGDHPEIQMISLSLL
jgi:DNA polymerase III delta prime subunit